MSIQDEIIKTIEMVVGKYMKYNTMSQDVATMVTEISDNKYKVKINNSEYWIKNGVGIELSVGSQVWVHIPNGKLKDMFIMAKR